MLTVRAPSRAVTQANQIHVLAAGLQGQGLSCLAIGVLSPHNDQSLRRPPSNAMPTSPPRSTATNIVITLVAMRRPLIRRQAPSLDLCTSMAGFPASALRALCAHISRLVLTPAHGSCLPQALGGSSDMKHKQQHSPVPSSPFVNSGHHKVNTPQLGGLLAAIATNKAGR